MTFPRHFQIQDDVFHIPIVVVWGVTPAEFCQFMKQKIGLDMDDNTLSGDGVFVSVTVDGREGGVIGFPHPFDGTPHNYAVLAHECLHAAIHMLDSRGVVFSEESEEVYTYFVDYLVENLAEGMLRTEKRLRSRKRK